MAGLCGAIGGDLRGVERMCSDLCVTSREETTIATVGESRVATAHHSFDAEPQPVRTADGSALWVWGDVWSVRRSGGYEAVSPPPAQVCASLYDEHGTAFVERLNGNFVGLLVDPDAGETTFFTDRLGTRPLHYARTDDGVAFATNVQALALHGGYDPTFDVERLAEYFTFQRTFGVRTPLVGVELLQPGSVTTVDHADGTIDVERYWTPSYEPVDRSRSYFVERLAETFRQVVDERTRPGVEYGLLLSGGGDSRLVMAALDALSVPFRAYHLADWDNEEADAAKRAASEADAEFEILRRSDGYQADQLATTPAFSNFVGYFNQVHASGFADRIGDEVDVLWSGHYGDMLFRGNHVPTPNVDLGALGSFDLPVEQPVSTVDALVDARTGSRTAPAYVDHSLDRPIAESYARDVERRGDVVVDHGVAYRSPREAVVCSRIPLTNGTSQFFYDGTLQLLPSRTPFLDNRLVDLFLSTPMEYLLRDDLVGAATQRLAPSLAAVPRGETGVGLDQPFAIQWTGRLGRALRRRHFSDTQGPPHWTHGPWPDHAELVRSSDFVRRTLDDRETLGRQLPFLDWDAVEACYRAHRDGENRLRELYTLVTFLEMPLARRIAAGPTARRTTDRSTLER